MPSYPILPTTLWVAVKRPLHSSWVSASAQLLPICGFIYFDCHPYVARNDPIWLIFLETRLNPPTSLSHTFSWKLSGPVCVGFKYFENRTPGKFTGSYWILGFQREQGTEWSKTSGEFFRWYKKEKVAKLYNQMPDSWFFWGENFQFEQWIFWKQMCQMGCLIFQKQILMTKLAMETQPKWWFGTEIFPKNVLKYSGWNPGFGPPVRGGQCYHVNVDPPSFRVVHVGQQTCEVPAPQKGKSSPLKSGVTNATVYLHISIVNMLSFCFWVRCEIPGPFFSMILFYKIASY